MIEDYKAPEKHSPLAVAIAFAVFISLVFWAIWDNGIESGRRDAIQELGQPVKYRCHEGNVYRRTNGYWESTKQTCKTLEEIK